MRYLQDAGGGGSSPNVAYLNELEAFAFVGQAAIAFTYDTNGNQKTRTQDDIKETYGHDYANRVASYTRENTATLQTLASWTYLYAPTGDRVNKDDVLADKKEWFMYDGSDVATDYSQSGANLIVLATSYVQSLSIDSKIARIAAAGGATHYYLPDALGSVHALLDSAQSRQNLQLTTAWGEKLPGFSSSSSVQDRHGFAQREKDAESSLMHFRARAYDPRLGRFVQKDPFSLGRVRTHYRYASNRPTGTTDPTGMYNVTVHFHMTRFLAWVAGFGSTRSLQIAAADQFVDEHSETESVQMRRRVVAGLGTFFISIPRFIGGFFINLFGGKSLGRAAIASAAETTAWAIPEAAWRLHFPARSKTERVEPAYKEENGLLYYRNMHAVRVYELGIRRLERDPWEFRDRNLTLVGIGMHTIQDSYAHQGFTGAQGHAGEANIDDPREKPSRTMKMAKATLHLLQSANRASRLGGGGTRVPDWEKEFERILKTPLQPGEDREDPWIRLWNEKIGGVSGKWDSMRKVWFDFRGRRDFDDALRVIRFGN